MLKQKEYDIEQFVLNDIVVKEDRVYRTYSMDKFFHRNNNQNNMRDKSTINYINDTINFNASYQDNVRENSPYLDYISSYYSLLNSE